MIKMPYYELPHYAWNDCSAIEAWLQQWIKPGTQDEDTCARHLESNDRKGLENFLAETLGDHWKTLNQGQKNKLWNCALSCRAYKLSTLGQTMTAKASIRW
jgi:hypothetical protein